MFIQEQKMNKFHNQQHKQNLNNIISKLNNMYDQIKAQLIRSFSCILQRWVQKSIENNIEDLKNKIYLNSEKDNSINIILENFLLKIKFNHEQINSAFTQAIENIETLYLSSNITFTPIKQQQEKQIHQKMAKVRSLSIGSKYSQRKTSLFSTSKLFPISMKNNTMTSTFLTQKKAPKKKYKKIQPFSQIKNNLYFKQIQENIQQNNSNAKTVTTMKLKRYQEDKQENKCYTNRIEKLQEKISQRLQSIMLELKHTKDQLVKHNQYEREKQQKNKLKIDKISKKSIKNSLKMIKNQQIQDIVDRQKLKQSQLQTINLEKNIKNMENNNANTQYENHIGFNKINKIDRLQKDNVTILQNFIKISKKISLPISKHLLDIFYYQYRQQCINNKKDIDIEYQLNLNTFIKNQQLLFIEENLKKLKKLFEIQSKGEKNTKIESYIRSVLQCIKIFMIKPTSSFEQDEKLDLISNIQIIIQKIKLEKQN